MSQWFCHRFIPIALIAATFLIADAQMMAGGNPTRGRKRELPPSKFVPMHLIEKEAGFKVVVLPRSGWNNMASEMIVLPKGFAGLKAPHKVVLLTYGSKKGGIVRIYQTPTVAGTTPEAFVKKVAEAGAFRDVNRRPGWQVAGRKIGNLFVVPTSTDGPVVKAALAEIG